MKEFLLFKQQNPDEKEGMLRILFELKKQQERIERERQNNREMNSRVSSQKHFDVLSQGEEAKEQREEMRDEIEGLRRFAIEKRVEEEKEHTKVLEALGSVRKGILSTSKEDGERAKKEAEKLFGLLEELKEKTTDEKLLTLLECIKTELEKPKEQLKEVIEKSTKTQTEELSKKLVFPTEVSIKKPKWFSLWTKEELAETFAEIFVKTFKIPKVSLKKVEQILERIAQRKEIDLPRDSRGRIEVVVDRTGGGFDKSGLATEETLQAILEASGGSSTPLITTLRKSGNLTYIGEAEAGSATSSAVWSITRLDSTNGLDVRLAGGNTTREKVFDNYSSLTYL